MAATTSPRPKQKIYMSTMSMTKNIKELFPEYIVLIKIGAFVETFNDDAKILGSVFKYRIKSISGSSYTCGFPKTSINKILGTLEELKINYLLVNKAHNYDEEGKQDYKKENNYNLY